MVSIEVWPADLMAMILALSVFLHLLQKPSVCLKHGKEIVPRQADKETAVDGFISSFIFPSVNELAVEAKCPAFLKAGGDKISAADAYGGYTTVEPRKVRGSLYTDPTNVLVHDIFGVRDVLVMDLCPLAHARYTSLFCWLSAT